MGVVGCGGGGGSGDGGFTVAAALGFDGRGLEMEVGSGHI